MSSKDLEMELIKLGFDTEALKVFLFNLVLANVRENVGEYKHIKNIDPIDLAEGIIRSAVIMDEASKLKALEAFENLAKQKMIKGEGDY